MAKRKTQEETFAIQLIGIDLIGVEMVTFDGVPIDPRNLQFNVNAQQKIVNENNYVGTFLKVTIIDPTKDNKELGSITTFCTFSIDGIDKYIDTKAKKVDIPDEIMLTVASVTISTTRGIMFSTFRGTPLHSAILPIIDARKLSLSPIDVTNHKQTPSG